MSRHELTVDAARAAPAVAVAAADFAGMPLADWVSLLTIVYLLALLAEKSWKGWQAMKAKKQRRRRASDRACSDSAE